MAEQTYLTPRQLWHKQYYQANRQKIIDHQMQYYNTNREKILVYTRQYNRQYYQANKTVNVQARKIEEAVPNDASASSLKHSKPATVEKVLSTKVDQSVPSQWKIPEDAKPWMFVVPLSPKRQPHVPQKKKPVFQYLKGQFDLAFD